MDDIYRKIVVKVPVGNTERGEKAELKKWENHYSQKLGGKHMKDHVLVIPHDHDVSVIQMNPKYENLIHTRRKD